MQNTTQPGKISDLIYQGPLIGMRPKSAQGDAATKTTPSKKQ